MVFGPFNMETALQVRYEEGLLAGGLEMAKRLLSHGFDVDRVVHLTDLDRDTIQRLADEQAE